MITCSKKEKRMKTWTTPRKNQSTEEFRILYENIVQFFLFFASLEGRKSYFMCNGGRMTWSLLSCGQLSVLRSERMKFWRRFLGHGGAESTQNSTVCKLVQHGLQVLPYQEAEPLPLNVLLGIGSYNYLVYYLLMKSLRHIQFYPLLSSFQMAS